MSKRNSYLPSPMSSPPRSVSPTLLSSIGDKNSTTLSTALFDPILTPNEECHGTNDYLSVKRSTLPPPPTKRNTNKKQPTTPLLAVIQKYISDLEGRDKSIKIIQYAFKILLHYRYVDSKRWSTMVSHFSQTRKILRVGHCVGTVRDMMDSYSSLSLQKQRPLHLLATWCTFLITLGNEVADDIFCFYKMGVFGSSIGKKAEKVSIYCWFIGILIDLRSNLMSLHSLLQKQQHSQALSTDDQEIQLQKILLARVSCTKLMLDGIFCACDIWEPSFSSGLQAWAGFFSGSLSGYKLWCKMNSS